MAFENYIRDLSYLTSGNLSDLTLSFGNKTWKIHKTLAVCHSKWFQKALTNGFEETGSGLITLKDEPEYADAIDCLVSYFYEAGYNASKYDTSEALLHAQVAVLADKYDCASLYNLAITSLAKSMRTIESDEWRVTAAFLYEFTTTEAPAHQEIRDLVIAAVASRYFMLKSILRNESVVGLLRSNADIATDLLLGRQHGSMAKDVYDYHFTCDHCNYSHSGPQDCPNVNDVDDDGLRICPACDERTRENNRHCKRKVEIYQAFSCTFCDGLHTKTIEQDFIKSALRNIRRQGMV